MNDSSLEDPVFYGARDSIYADIKNKQVHLYGEAWVDNGEIDMNAGYILLDIEANEIFATHAYDEDSNRIEFPVFSDGSEEIKASSIRYNLETKKGYIEEVAVQQDENFLYMEVAKKQANDQIHFKKGRFTTCNLEDPHYHFQLSKAVLVPEKRIVSGPMNLWLKGVPTPLGLPFSIIPQAEEKSKGLVFPNFVPISQYGFGFQDLGYYIPINDRVQTTFYGSLYSRGSWEVRNTTDYYSRYKFRGGFNLGFRQLKSGFPDNVNDNKTTVNWTHTKDPKSSPYWGFTSRVNFVSDNNNQNNLDPNNPIYFNNTLSSDINLTRAFPGKPFSAGAKISMRQNSISQNVSLTSPIVNFNVTRFYPLRKLVNGTRGWKQAIARFGVTYNFEGQNRAVFSDTLIRNRDLQGVNDQFLNGINQSVRMQTTVGLFGNTWKLSPSFDYGNKINFQSIEDKFYDDSTESVESKIVPVGGMAHTMSANAQLTTVLYSYYKFIGKKEPLLRHVLTPSFTYSFRPALNGIDSSLIVTPVDTFMTHFNRFDNSIYSAGSINTQNLLTFGFNNTFELKHKSEKDTVDGFKRIRLVDALSIRGSYDFSDTLTPWSDIRSSLRISPTKWLNFVGSSTFSLYSWDSTGSTLTDLAINDKGTLGRFTDNSLATTLTFTSKESREKLDNQVSNISQNWNADYEFFALHPEQLINFQIPWKLNLSHVYTVRANQNITSDDTRKWTQLQTLMLNGDLSFTQRWKISSTTNFDLIDQRITNALFILTRDMHCWALSFRVTPIGGNKSFLFSIRSTSSLFQDAKIDIQKPPAFL